MSMSFREFIEKLDKEKKLLKTKKKPSLKLEVASLLHSVEPKPLMTAVEGSDYKIAGNIFASKELVAEYLGCKKEDLVKKMLDAIEKPSEPKLVDKSEAPVLEHTIKDVDLSKFPIPFHLEKV